VYALEQFKEAFDQSLKSNRGRKILFKFGATDIEVCVINVRYALES
jgi:hypothetical protein